MISLTKLGRTIGDFPNSNQDDHNHGVYFGSLFSNVTEVSGAYNFTQDFHIFLKAIDVRNPEAPNFNGMKFYLLENVTTYDWAVYSENDTTEHGITVHGEQHLEKIGEHHTVTKHVMPLSDWSYEEFVDGNGEKWFRSTTPVASYNITKYPYEVTGDDDIIQWDSYWTDIRSITSEGDYDTTYYWAAYENGAWVEKSTTTTHTVTEADKRYSVMGDYISQNGFALESNLTGIATDTIEPFSKFCSNNLYVEDDYHFRPSYLLTYSPQGTNSGIITKDLVGHRGFIQTGTIFQDWTATLDDEPNVALVQNPYETPEGYVETERENHRRVCILYGEGDIIIHTYIITLSDQITDWEQYIRTNLRDFTDYDLWKMETTNWVAWDYRDVPNIMDVHQQLNTIYCFYTGYTVTGYGGAYYANSTENPLTTTYEFPDASEITCNLLLMDNTGALSIQENVAFEDAASDTLWKQYVVPIPSDKFLVSAYNLSCHLNFFLTYWNGVSTMKPIIFMNPPA